MTENTSWTGYIRDNAWNIIALPYNITWISLSWPIVYLFAPLSGSILTWSVEFMWYAVANNPTCQELSWWYNIVVYSWTDEVYTWNTWGTQINTVLPDWTYTWNVYTTDILWHTSISETWTLIIRTWAPICDIDYTPGSWSKTSWDVLAVLTWCTPGTTWFNATWHIFTGNWTYEFTFENELWITWNAIANVRWIDKEPPVLHEVTPIWSTTDTTPDYTFSSTEAGTIIYGWSCSSSTTTAISWNNKVTFNTLAVWTYSDCTIIVVDEAWNSSEPLLVSEFTIKSSWGHGSSSLKRDDCPDWDFSDSYYDGTCEWWDDSDEIIDICKVNESNYSDEMKLAYLYAYSHWMTTMCPIDDADLYGYLRRDHLAKILTEYSLDVLDLEPEAGKAWCNSFDDIANESAEMKYYIKTSCELWLMWLESDWDTPKKSFDPTDYVTRAEFGTTLSRLIYGDEYNLESEAENTYPWAWYWKHLAALKRDGIMNEIYWDWPQHIELRWYVMLMIMRHGKWRLDNVNHSSTSTKSTTKVNSWTKNYTWYLMSIYKENGELSCTFPAIVSETWSQMFWLTWIVTISVKNSALKQTFVSHDGTGYDLFSWNKLYEWWDLYSYEWIWMEADITNKNVIEDLLNWYDSNNKNSKIISCKSSVKKSDVSLDTSINFVDINILLKSLPSSSRKELKSSITNTTIGKIAQFDF